MAPENELRLYANRARLTDEEFEAVRTIMRRAVREEREACASIAEAEAADDTSIYGCYLRLTAKRIAQKIRARE